MNRTRLFAGALMAAGITGCIGGCIMLPPPPPMFQRTPPGFRGEGAPMPFDGARRPPPGADMCDARDARGAPGDGLRHGCARGVPGTPDAPAPGARW